MERRRIFYRGRVQGVGFRYTASSIARGFPVTGWVRNLADGRVELLIEGAITDLQAVLQNIADRMGTCIQHAEIFAEAATGEFTDFKVTG
jgi:acylphosphatase